jgi:hypothetical protein
VGAGFRKRSCSNKQIERGDDSKKNHPDLDEIFSVPGGSLAMASVGSAAIFDARQAHPRAAGHADKLP